MSRSLTVKPSVGGTVNRGRGNTRGRGRGTQPNSTPQRTTGRGTRMNNQNMRNPGELDDGTGQSDNPSGDNSQESRMERY